MRILKASVTQKLHFLVIFFSVGKYKKLFEIIKISQKEISIQAETATEFASYSLYHRPINII